jgi:parallel beta-helix repeat protein
LTIIVIASIATLAFYALWFSTDLRFLLIKWEVIRVPADCPTIQKAIDLVKDGGTVRVSPGIYAETLVIKKPVDLLGENKTNTIIQGIIGTDILIELRAQNIRISGLTIKGAQRAISSMEGARNCLIEDNVITNNGYGVYLDSVPYNSFVNNTFANNDVGMYFFGSGNTVVINNTLTGNKVGLSPESNSKDFVFKGNKLRNNGVNIKFNIPYWDSSWNLSGQVDDTNTIDGKTIRFLFNQSNLVIDPRTFPNTGYLIVINSENITVKDMTFSNNDYGLMLLHTNSSIVENVTLSNNYEGILLHQSSDNKVIGCTSFGNSYGIHLNHLERCTIQTCNLSRNAYDGAFLENSLNCTIDNNIIVGSEIGVKLTSSHENIIRNNTVNGTVNGICIYLDGRSHGNVIQRNILERASSAVLLWGGSYSNVVDENTIAHNLIGIEFQDITTRDLNNVHDNSFVENDRDFFDHST